MIARTYGADVESEAPARIVFADDGDIPEWAKGAVYAVRQSGLVQGRDGNRFAPESTATRAEAITIIINLLRNE